MQRTVDRGTVRAAVLFATAFCLALTGVIAYGAFHQHVPPEWPGIAYMWLILWPLLFALSFWHDVTKATAAKLIDRFRPYLWS